MVGYPFTDEVSHQFLALVSPTDADGDPNPCYDVTRSSTTSSAPAAARPGRVAIREEYIRSGYEDADEKLGIARALMGGNPTTFAGSDHGFAPAVLRGQRERGAEPGDGRRRLTAREQRHASNCGAVGGVPSSCTNRARTPTDDIAKACWAGGTIQIYVNPTGSGTRRSRRRDVPDLRRGPHRGRARLRRPSPTRRTPASRSSLRIMDKEELRERRRLRLAASEPQRRRRRRPRPPYQSDAGTTGVRRSRCRTSSASTATCRTWSTCEQHQHARDVRRWRARASSTWTNVEDLRADRHRADARRS